MVLGERHDEQREFFIALRNLFSEYIIAAE